MKIRELPINTLFEGLQDSKRLDWLAGHLDNAATEECNDGTWSVSSYPDEDGGQEAFHEDDFRDAIDAAMEFEEDRGRDED